MTTPPYDQTPPRIFVIYLALPGGRGVITEGLRRVWAALGLALDVLGTGASHLLASALLWWSTASGQHRKTAVLSALAALVLLYTIPALRPLTLAAAFTAIAVTGTAQQRHVAATPEARPDPATPPA